jgi:hypothetical protein
VLLLQVKRQLDRQQGRASSHVTFLGVTLGVIFLRVIFWGVTLGVIFLGSLAGLVGRLTSSINLRRRCILWRSLPNSVRLQYSWASFTECFRVDGITRYVPVPVKAAGGAYGEPAHLRFRLVSAHPERAAGFGLWDDFEDTVC